MRHRRGILQFVCVLDVVRDLVAEKVAPRAAEIDERGEFPEDIRRLFAQNDLLGIPIPVEYGGLGGTFLTYVKVVEEIAKACASSSLIVAVQELGMLPILIAGTPQQKAKFLPKFASGEWIAAYALTEAASGSDAAGSMRTRAHRDGDDYVLNGQKIWITHGSVADAVCVFAVTDPDKGASGISAFMAERGFSGFHIGKLEKKMGIRGSPTVELLFEDCRIPAENMIGAPGEGFKIAMKVLDKSRPGIAAQALGIAQGALDYATEYTKQRVAFGKPISQQQGLQFMLADMKTEVEAALLLLYEAALNATRDRPILGWGPDSFGVAFPNYRTADPAGAPGNQPESSAHNWLLEAAATTGIVGALSALALVVVAAEELYRVGLRRVPALAGPLLLGLIAYWAHGLVSGGSVRVAWFGWAGLGAAASVTTAALPAALRRRLDFAGSAVAVGASCLVSLVGVFALDASHLAASAQSALSSRRFDVAAASASAATNRDSGRAEYWEVLGLAHAANERWRDAGNAFAEAAKHAPYIATHYANVARNRARQALAGDQSSGGPDAALNAARRAVAVDPNNWESESVLAEVQNAFGQPEQALETLATAVALSSTNANNDTVAAEAAGKLTDPQRARALLERILVIKESAALRLALANVALRLNDRELARANVQRALQLDPANVDAQRLISSLGG